MHPQSFFIYDPGLLQEYRGRYGDAHTGYREGDDPELARWCSKQRRAWKEGTLDADKEAMLQQLGFEWAEEDAEWGRWFHELQQHEERTDSSLPSPLTDLTGRYILSFLFFFSLFFLLIFFFFLFLLCPALNLSLTLFVTPITPTNPTTPITIILPGMYMMNWCSVQRVARRCRRLSEARIGKLDSIAFVWDAADPLS